MPRMDITPTRRNYLEISRGLARIQSGHDLLEQKRQILIMELMAQVEAAKRVKSDVERTMAAAYGALRTAAMHSGMTGLMRQSCGISMDHSLDFRSRSVMGVPVPQIRCTAQPFGLQFGLTDGHSCSDELLRGFLDALPLVAELAEVENAVFRLAREIRRTQRRVRALEKIYIPQYKEALKYIAETLAERQREEFIVLRRVKRKRRAAAPPAGGPSVAPRRDGHPQQTR